MKNKLFIVFLLCGFCSLVLAHSGRTDSSGGHNCSQKSKDKGLCTGYHYHNDGSIHSDFSDDLILIDSNRMQIKVRQQENVQPVSDEKHNSPAKS